ncbi:MAG: hypothetical protein KGO05_03895, partial [Chloroflexota bacterium]|nr:hypothetical protein [Chloroflexota bacterium]
MTDKGKQPSTRKPAHVIPLTHRQQRAKKRPQAEQAASAPSASGARKRAAASTPPRARRTAPVAVVVAEPTPASAIASAPLVAEPILTPEPLAESASLVVEAPAESAAEPDTQVEPRLVRVRVRRKSAPLAQILPPDITREDTTILTLPRDFAPRATPTDPPFADAPLTPPSFVAPAEQPQPQLAAPAMAVAEEPEIATEQLEQSAPTAPVEVAPEPPEVVEPEVVEPDATEQPETEQPETEQPETEQLGRRRMPTLAVMAALAPRTEPTPTAPLPDLDMAPGATDAADALVAVSQDASQDASQDTSDEVSQDVSGEANIAAEDAVIDAPPPVDEVIAGDEPLAEAPAEVELTGDAEEASAVVAESAASDEPAESGEAAEASVPAVAVPAPRAWMWWTHPPRRRAATPETAPIAAAAVVASPASEPPDQDVVNTAPRRGVRRTASAPSAPHEPAQAEDSRHEAAQAVSIRADAEVDALAERRRATRLRERHAARRSRRAVTLSWVAFGHAAIASVAALIAVIAGLRATSGADAAGTLVWALILALIAGLGAGFGYFFAQDGRPLLATLSLVLSQLGAVAWAMALFGPRASLLALAPASVALALRGSGRLSAFATGCAWFLLYWVDLALTLTGTTHPAATLGVVGAALVDSALTLVGLWMIVNILISLYTSRMNVVARGRAVEHVALQTEAQLADLRAQTEDDAAALRHALADALRGEQPERVYAQGALSAVAEAINLMADRLVDLRYDRDERKRLESATRRLTRVIERAWLGLSWSWPEATGTILDDLLALMRTPPPPDAPDQLDVTSPTGQVVAPHLFRGWRPTEPTPRVASPDAMPDAALGTPSQ